MADPRGMDIVSALNMREKQALETFVSKLQLWCADKVLLAALFGSKARGDSMPDSDIDILIILHKEDRALRREVIALASRVSLEHDVLLSPRVMGKERWERQQGFTLYRNIIRDALALAVVQGELWLAPGFLEET